MPPAAPSTRSRSSPTHCGRRGATIDLRHPTVCFVPTVSAVSIRDIDKQSDLYSSVDQLDPNEADLDDFHTSGTNTPHTAITHELGQWLVDRIGDR